jgi:hypothetical protein
MAVPGVQIVDSAGNSVSVAGGTVPVSGTFSATTVFPYAMTDAQAAAAASALGVLGSYFASPPTLTNGQVNPLMLDASGNLKVNVEAGDLAGVLPVGAANFVPNQATLTTTAAALIVAARTGAQGTGRVSVTIVSGSTTAIALGGSGVTFTTGVVLPGTVGASITIPTTAAIYGSLSAAGSALVSYYETY